jgi:hypothetical protein
VASVLGGTGVSGVPDFLVIGAQKCGTTTLYQDLRAHPAIHVGHKESTWLLDARPTRSFERPSGHVAGEVTTDYSMLPKIDAASRARSRLETVKVIYIVRDPVARVISHHHHHLAAELVDPDIDVAVHECPELVDNSRYATQLAPWLDAFGHQNVRVVRFEDYMGDRVAGSRELQEFLGVEVRSIADLDVAHNASTEKRVATGRWARFRTSRLYHDVIRRALPEPARRRVARRVLPSPIERPAPPDPDTLAWLVAELAPEVERLAGMLDTEPWWDLATAYGVSGQEEP